MSLETVEALWLCVPGLVQLGLHFTENARAVTSKVTIPIMVARMQEDLLEAPATALCRTSAVCAPISPGELGGDRVLSSVATKDEAGNGNHDQQDGSEIAAPRLGASSMNESTR